LDYLGEERRSGWRVWFADNTERPSQIFTASRLTVNGAPLKCVPDLVLVHEPSGEILIVERKTTFVSESRIPSDGWPNVQAQLWCYSWIDQFATCPRVRLIGQLWTRSSWGALSLCQHHPAWDRTGISHEQYCERLFKDYGGFVAPLPEA
jgi:hypothetical protein